MRFGRGFLVEMKELRIEAARESLDLIGRKRMAGRSS